MLQPSPQPSRPLLKWAGGKRQLLPALRRYYPDDFDRYVEPFFGSGAVFFDLYASGKLDGRRIVLTDVNTDLIGCYRAVREDPEAVISALRPLEEEHHARGAECYYEVRDRRFNPARNGRQRYTPVLAAMFIYLNRTGYNGLFRLNQRGAFNVPAGRYVNPTICDPDRIRTAAAALGARGVTIECAPFDQSLADALTGDFVYCDPPYAPLSPTSSFAHYTAGGFTDFDQTRLLVTLIAAARRGASLLISNSSARDIEAAYTSHGARAAGLRVRRIAARRAINSNAARRGVVDELVITNVHTRALDRISPRMLRGAAGPAGREASRRAARDR